MLMAPVYMRAVGADPATIREGTAYLRAYIPGLALQFALVSMGSALRGTGIVKPTMLVQIVTVVMNTGLNAETMAQQDAEAIGKFLAESLLPDLLQTGCAYL